MPVLPAILEVAIGAALIFFTLSAICSSFSELVSNVLDLRSKFLEQGIVALVSHPDQVRHIFEQIRQGQVNVSDPYSKQLVPFVRGLIDHPLLQKLDRSRGTNPIVRRLRDTFRSSNIKLPAYVNSQDFSSALLDEVRALALDPSAQVAALTAQLQTWGDQQQSLKPVLDALKDPNAQQALEQARRASDQIPNEQMRGQVTALLDAHDPAKRVAALKAQLQDLGNQLGAGADGLGNAPSKLASRIPQTILNAFDKANPQEALQLARQALPLIEDQNVRLAVTNLLSAWELTQIEQGISYLPEPPRKILLAFVAETQSQIGQVAQLKERVENWFDNSMGQVSIWYKQYLAWFLRGFAVLACIAFNADALHIVDTLWRDPTVRAALVAQAQTVASSTPVPQATPSPGATSPPGSGLGNAVQAVQTQLQQAEGLPLGWNCDEFNVTFRNGYQTVLLTSPSASQSGGTPTPPTGLCEQIQVPSANGTVQTFAVQGGSWPSSAFWMKLVGLLLMSIGVSLGSDFWYKALKQLVALREDKPQS